MIRVLHTADWHLGARLVNNDRAEEHALFLDWLLTQIEARQPNLLVVAGDVFDSAHPAQEVLAQYYGFLALVVSRTPVHVLVIGGNHDSALTLNAPRELLRSLRIRVVGAASEPIEEALFELNGAVVCAVPFLRERDLRRAAPGQTYEQVAADLRRGIHDYYQRVLALARALGPGKPILATGHLAAVGGQASESERDIHIGNLGAVSAECLEGFGYVALGHLHRPQSVNGCETIRYAGSPLPIGFDEAADTKQCLLVTLAAHGATEAEAIAVPCFRPLVRRTCRMGELRATLNAIRPAPGQLDPWVELTVGDGAAQPDLDQQVREAGAGLPLSVLKLVVPPPPQPGEEADPWHGRTLAELKPREVFAERLRANSILPDSDQGRALAGTFDELLSKMREGDGAVGESAI